MEIEKYSKVLSNKINSLIENHCKEINKSMKSMQRVPIITFYINPSDSETKKRNVGFITSNNLSNIDWIKEIFVNEVIKIFGKNNDNNFIKISSEDVESDATNENVNYEMP